jgi:hypothetical protein
MPFDDYPDDEIDEREESVLQALRGHKSFFYEQGRRREWKRSAMHYQCVG